MYIAERVDVLVSADQRQSHRERVSALPGFKLLILSPGSMRSYRALTGTSVYLFVNTQSGVVTLQLDNGGTVRAGKDSANCDDSRGNPGKHHGEASQAVVVSGRGPAAATKQLTTGRRTGINSQTKDDYAKDSSQEDINPVKRSTRK